MHSYTFLSFLVPVISSLCDGKPFAPQRYPNHRISRQSVAVQTDLSNLALVCINHAVDLGPLWMNPEHQEVISDCITSLWTFSWIFFSQVLPTLGDVDKNGKARFGNLNPSLPYRAVCKCWRYPLSKKLNSLHSMPQFYIFTAVYFWTR